MLSSTYYKYPLLKYVYKFRAFLLPEHHFKNIISKSRKKNLNPNAYPCQRVRNAPLSRRDMLSRCASGFGAVALAALGGEKAFAGQLSDELGKADHGPHHKVRAKNVIFLFMDGGPSQIDTFDPKPLLDKHHGKDPGAFFEVEPTQFNNNGTVLKSPCLLYTSDAADE